MIDREQAKRIAADWLTKHPADGMDGPLDLCLLEEETIEANFGWVFFYVSRLYRETGDVRYAIAGNAPLIVDRVDGSLHETDTAQPVAHHIEQYRRNWQGPSAQFLCPCCGFLTFDREPGGTFDLCPVCFWEDDPVQFEDHDCAGGANHISLREAQINFRAFGASEQQFLTNVRPPRPDEIPSHKESGEG